MLYSALLTLHLVSVVASITLFIVRGIGVQYGKLWPMSRATRQTSVAIDMVLLGAGLSLWILAEHNPLVEPWLGVKLILIVLYIVIGSFALKRATTLLHKRLFLAAAVGLITYIFSVALTRHPLGVFVS